MNIQQLQNLNAMDSSTIEFGESIIEAGANGRLAELKVIRRKVVDSDIDIEFVEICDQYRDFSTGQNVLHRAAQMGHLHICKFLINNVKVHINAFTYKRDTALMLAVNEQHVEMVKYLISQGAEVEMENSKGFTALHNAVMKDNRELMEFLLIEGAKIDADSVDGTPLQCAASSGNVEAVKLLLSCGAKPNYTFLLLESPLVCAIKSHSIECMEALLEGKKADPDKFTYGFSPLSYAAKEGDTKYLNSLLKAGANPNAEVTGLTDPIEDAALANNRENVEILFPLTKPLERIPNWSVDGIIEHCHSEETKKMTETRRMCRLAKLDRMGEHEVRQGNHGLAVVYFKVAQCLDPSNPKWASKASLCLAHISLRLYALLYAEECLRLNTHGPYHTYLDVAEAAAAAQISKKYIIACLGFMLDPRNDESDEALRIFLFDQFASLYLMTSPDKIARFTPSEGGPSLRGRPPGPQNLGGPKN